MVDYQLTNLRRLVVDGEDFFILDPIAVERVLLEGASIDGALLFSESLAGVAWEIVKKYPDLDLGFHRGLFSRNKWWACVLFNSEEKGHHRVNLQNEVCSNCGWQGVIGNPLQFEIYAGSEDREKAFERAKQLNPVNCPNCSEPFQVFAVWVGE
ncbi:hypothetical protein [Microbulbifer thermotolerans]|uniref:hypothetical protein n=1 Tax=Microbulbifer thermotolerans TaxID=252514 RepID=UPI00111377F0|nr:hypothetical protein [Microbulbifer thermotolerans]MCX2795087.1 hypothetical protein [Microbulbifer thermotolerans]MCX2833143.1 hypothetical protein [Microbulbifer thermotolerans]